jgi:thiamine pyrophosphate-dependent acetolactate synthase large subunit-like protein
MASAIAGRLDASSAPALVVGAEVERSGAWDAVVALAERSRAAVWTAPLSGLSGFPEGHPLYQGRLPPGAGWVARALEGRDLVLVLGAPAFRYYPQISGPYLAEGTELIQITAIRMRRRALRSATPSSRTSGPWSKRCSITSPRRLDPRPPPDRSRRRSNRRAPR